MLCEGATIKLFTDYPNSVPVDSDFLLFQRGGSYVNASQSQFLPVWLSNIVLTNASLTNLTVNNLYSTYITNLLEYSTNLYVTTNFTDVSYVTNLFVDNSITTNAYITNLTVNNITNNTFSTTNVTINYPGGLTNLNLTAKTVMWADDNKAVSSVANALGILTNDSAGNVGFSTTLSLTEIDALNFYPTNLFTGLTNYNLLGTDANGLLTLGSGAITNITITNAYIQNLTNNTFVNTNIFISTSNAYFNNVYATNTFFDTNFVTNLYFVSGKGNTLIITNVAVYGVQTNFNIAASSAVITKADQVLTNAVNAVGAFTNSSTGPPSFGLIQSNVIAAGISPILNLQVATNLLLASVSSPTNGVSTASSIDFTLPEAVTNIAGAVSQTSVLNFNQTNINHAIRWYVNRTGSDQTITVGTWETDSGRTSATTYTCTNNTTLGLMYTLYAGQFTNVASMKTFR